MFQAMRAHGDGNRNRNANESKEKSKEKNYGSRLEAHVLSNSTLTDSVVGYVKTPYEGLEARKVDCARGTPPATAPLGWENIVGGPTPWTLCSGALIHPPRALRRRCVLLRIVLRATQVRELYNHGGSQVRTTELDEPVRMPTPAGTLLFRFSLPEEKTASPVATVSAKDAAGSAATLSGASGSVQTAAASNRRTVGFNNGALKEERTSAGGGGAVSGGKVTTDRRGSRFTLKRTNTLSSLVAGATQKRRSSLWGGDRGSRGSRFSRFSSAGGGRSSMARKSVGMSMLDECEQFVSELLAETELSEPEATAAVLPIFMRASEGFGFGGSTLSAAELGEWHSRCRSWLASYSAMLSIGAHDDADEVRVERIDASVALVECVRRCTQLQSVSLRHGFLKDDALAIVCQQTKGRLRALDLHGTLGLSDIGLKAVAAHSAQLETLCLAGCNVSDDSLIKIARYCPKLRRLELTGGGNPQLAAAVTSATTDLLSPDCVVERVTLEAELVDRIRAREQEKTYALRRKREEEEEEARLAAEAKSNAFQALKERRQSFLPAMLSSFSKRGRRRPEAAAVAL